MKVPPLATDREYEEIAKELTETTQRVLQSGAYILGPEVQGFQNSFAGWVGAAHSLGVASGTDALILALRALGVGEGDEVITTSFTYFATIESIVTVGAHPVLVDINPKTFNIDVSKIEEKITPKTKAILLVHLYGQCADTDAICRIAKKNELVIVEDAAQAHGASINGKKAGNLGDVGCFSFYPTKNLGACGDGGAVTFSRDDLMDRLLKLRAHGASLEDRYYHEIFGMNSRLDELQAAILNVKLKKLDEWIAARQRIAKTYSDELRLDWLQTPFVDSGYSHTFHQYVVRADDRDGLEKFLKEKGISVNAYYRYPMHLLPPVRKLAPVGFQEGDYPEAEKASREVLSLPCFPQMTEGELSYVIDSVRKFKK